MKLDEKLILSSYFLAGWGYVLFGKIDCNSDDHAGIKYKSTRSFASSFKSSIEQSSISLLANNSIAIKPKFRKGSPTNSIVILLLIIYHWVKCTL
ncbi:MAG: hypothetical protein KAR85_01850 [Methanosarcinales archaeon]|nr:hypothetical protein [Methanosarcinales archaeon]